MSNLCLGKLQFESDEVHIWSVPLDELLSQVHILSKKLSMDEKKRADRFCFERDRNRYIIGRGILRTIISFYLDAEAGRLQLCYGRYGKPALSSNCNPKMLKFNMSHSNGLALYAFAHQREVGIDIEHIRDVPEMEQIAGLFFSDTEKKVFCSLPENKKKAIFFQIWTRKESYIKCIGTGLNESLDTFDVLSEADDIPGPIAGDLKKTSQWHIEDLNPSSAHAAAYAIRGHSRLCWYRYPTWQS